MIPNVITYNIFSLGQTLTFAWVNFFFSGFVAGVYALIFVYH